MPRAQAGTGSTTHSQAYDVAYTPVIVDLAENPSGMVTSSGNDVVIANNIANINTTGWLSSDCKPEIST